MITKILSKWYTIFFLILAIIIIGGFSNLSLEPTPLPSQEENDFSKEESLPAAVSKAPATTTIDTEIQESTFQPPEIVKAVYLTGWSASNPRVVDYVIDIAKNTEINAVVVDVKDWSGYITYDTNVLEAEQYEAERILIPDIEAFVERFHKQGIYVIARITVFQDPVLAWTKPNLAVYRKSNKFLLWLDKSGLAWIDPASKESWDYNIAIAEDALSRGFDELNFDYVRFPSDGNLENMGFPLWNGTTSKNLIIKGFYQSLREKLPQATLSVDLFGLSTVSSNFGVGQNIEDAYQYFDFVCPMVYPSHYVDGFRGYQNPAEYPYEIVKYSMDNALERLNVFNQVYPTKARLRPWLQDFDLGATYDKDMVQSEINGVSEALGEHFSGFMLWNSRNVYTIEALLPAD
ncbi:MAG: putative glycoside hydrolase [Candidatus Nealsonbacteria bacterium]